MIYKIKQWLNDRPEIKKTLHYCIVHPYRSRPRWWIRVFINPFIIKKGRGAGIAFSARKDIFPFNEFKIGYQSIIEDFATVNNGMGSIVIGDHCRIGIGSVVLGEVLFGNYVVIGQNCLITGLNHNYELTDVPFDLQGSYSDPVIIEDDVATGANVVINAGVRIGTHSFISAGSVVTRSIPPYSLVAGNPAKVIFNFKEGKVNK